MIYKDEKGNTISTINGYTKEKVLYAKAFIASINRNTTAKEFIECFNKLNNKNESLTNCSSCTIAKYRALIENYAYYGEKTLKANNLWEIKNEDNTIKQPKRRNTNRK